MVQLYRSIPILTLVLITIGTVTSVSNSSSIVQSSLINTNSTLGEMEIENRKLRQKLDDLELNMERKLEAGKLEMLQYAQSLEERLMNVLRQASENNSKKYDELISRLKHSASSSSSATCTSYSTPPDLGALLTLAYLDRHDVRCPEGLFLTQFHLVNVDPKIYYEFICCSII